MPKNQKKIFVTEMDTITGIEGVTDTIQQRLCHDADFTIQPLQAGFTDTKQTEFKKIMNVIDEQLTKVQKHVVLKEILMPTQQNASQTCCLGYISGNNG